MLWIEQGVCSRTFFGDEKQIVVIDPGHGGQDIGAKGPAGFSEKEAALKLALMLKDRLKDIYKVHLTRSGDYGVDLYDRTALANQHKADFFISLHMGSCPSSDGRGATVFWYSTQNISEQGASLGRPGNGGFVPWPRVQIQHQAESKKAAKQMMASLGTWLDEKQVERKGAPVAVLKGADMPALLVEVGCITSHLGEQKIEDPTTLLRYASLIAEAVDGFLKAQAR